MTHRPRASQKIVAVTGADTVVLGENPHRQAIVLSNADLYSPIWLSIRSPAAVGKGVLIPGGMRDVKFNWETEGNLTECELHAIATLTGAPAGAPAGFSKENVAVSGAATGVKQSFTVPAGQTGILQGATIFYDNLAPTVALQVVRGADTINLAQFTANGTFSDQFQLLAGDVVQWNVTTAVAASTFDITLSGVTSATAGAAPSSVNLVVWETEA